MEVLSITQHYALCKSTYSIKTIQIMSNVTIIIIIYYSFIYVLNFI
jgi:hypothetical protein